MPTIPPKLLRLESAVCFGCVRNVVREPMRTCRVCATPDDGHLLCWRCRDHRRVPGVAGRDTSGHPRRRGRSRFGQCPWIRPGRRSIDGRCRRRRVEYGQCGDRQPAGGRAPQVFRIRAGGSGRPAPAGGDHRAGGAQQSGRSRRGQIPCGGPPPLRRIDDPAAATPQATLGQRLYTARRRANLTAAALGAPADLIVAVESETPPPGDTRARIEELITDLNAG
jgi:hypothetical protein